MSALLVASHSACMVISMHALWEATNKADIYEAYKGYKAFIERP